MPLKKCTTNGKSGWKYGDAGKCYPAGSGKSGKKKAIKQGLAMGGGKLMEDVDVDEEEERKPRSAFARQIASRPFTTVLEAEFDESKHPRSDDGKFGPGSHVKSKTGEAKYTEHNFTSGEKFHHIDVKHGDQAHTFVVRKHPKKPGVSVSHQNQTGRSRNNKTSFYHISPKTTKNMMYGHAEGIVRKHISGLPFGGFKESHPHLHAAVQGIAHAIHHFANIGETAGKAVDTAASPVKTLKDHREAIYQAKKKRMG